MNGEAATPAPVDQVSLNVNKAAPGVEGYFPINEPDIGSAYTNTVCPPLVNRFPGLSVDL